MTLEELRTLRKTMRNLKVELDRLEGAPGMFDALIEFNNAASDYEYNSKKYVDSLIDAMPPEVTP